MKVVVSVDTEADDQWSHGAPLRTDNVRHWQPFQALCERHGAPVTFLVTSEIASDPEAGRLLSSWVERHSVEIGAHLHPWTTPPFVDAPGLRHNDPVHAFAGRLSDELLRAKLETLTEQVGNVTGRAPTSFRAGRFGTSSRLAKHLIELGYVVDSSVTPYLSWERGISGRGDDLESGPNFRCYDAHPFQVFASGSPGLIEIPLTVLPTVGLLRRCPRLLERYAARPVGALRRAERALRGAPPRWVRPQPVWVRPFPEYDLATLETVMRAAEREGLMHAVLMLHSSELMPGGSPYRRTAHDVADLLDLLDGFFARLGGAGHTFLTLTEAGRELASAPGLRSLPLPA
ncbi:MAG TPA: hypothetical protein VJ787_00480 [Thermoleophilia bacterium]|nr:hypothetical protein [Thermoleophilia bacterium]